MRFELDPAATMFVLGRTEQRSYLIRLSATLYEPVEETVLQAALERTVEKYPCFFIRFICSQNRLFAEPAKSIPAVREKRDRSNLKLWEGHGSCQARVTYSGKTIFLEFFHAVSDGKGGLEFLTYLTAAYLSVRHQDESILQSISPVSKAHQLENGYQKFAKGFRTKKTHGSSFQIKGTPGAMKITQYCLPVGEVRTAAKRCGVSVTEYMAALLCRAIAGVQRETLPEQRQKRIRLLIPVNLRTRFHCDTMRNFSLNVSLEALPEETGDLPGLCSKFHQSMQSAVRPEKLAGQCASVSRICDAGIVRRLPLSAKKWFVQTGLALPWSANSLTFSNMGEIVWPEELKSRVEGLGVAFTPKPEAPYSCSAVSLNGTMRLTLTRTIQEPVLERHLGKILSGQKISFKKI